MKTILWVFFIPKFSVRRKLFAGHRRRRKRPNQDFSTCPSPLMDMFSDFPSLASPRGVSCHAVLSSSFPFSCAQITLDFDSFLRASLALRRRASDSSSWPGATETRQVKRLPRRSIAPSVLLFGSPTKRQNGLTCLLVSIFRCIL